MIATFRKLRVLRSAPHGALPLSLEAAIYLAAALTVAGFGCYKVVTASSYMEAVKWSQAVSLVSQVVLVWLVARLSGQKPTALLVAITCAYAICLIIHLTSTSGLFLSELRDMYFVPLPWGAGETGARIALDPWRTPVDLSHAVAVIWGASALWRQYRRGDRLRAVLGGLVAAVVLAANLHDMVEAGPVFLAPYGLLIMLLAFWYAPLPAPPQGAVPAPQPTAPDDAPAPSWTIRSLPGDRNPLVGATLAMLLVSIAQVIASDTLENFVVLLVLVGMMQATIGTLRKVGSDPWLRQLAVVAFCVLGLSQVVSIIQGMEGFSAAFFLEAQGLLHIHVHEWLWVLGLLLLLSAFYLAGIEAGESRKALILEHDQLVAEVAERRRAEEKVRASEERFRTLIENCSDIIAVLDADARFRYVGASVQQVLGFAPETMVGKPVFAFCHPDDCARLKQGISQIVNNVPRNESGTEIRVRRADNSWRIMEAVGKNRLADPVLNGIVINARDITERKLMAERFESVKTTEQQRIRHDLHDTIGQDLTGLLCMAGSLARKLQNRSDVGPEQAEAIVEGVRHTMDDVRKAIQGIAPVEVDPQGLEIALRQLVEKARAQNELAIEFECVTPAPSLDYGDATQLFRIAQEALTNALKHAQARRVVVSLRTDNEYVVIAVTDDGVGAGARRGPGAGIGLHTMRSRAVAIGATLNIVEPPEGGTCVLCTLSKNSHVETAPEKGPYNFAI